MIPFVPILHLDMNNYEGKYFSSVFEISYTFLWLSFVTRLSLCVLLVNMGVNMSHYGPYTPGQISARVIRQRFQHVFCGHTQAIFADDEPSEHANSFPDIRWRLM